MSPRLVLAIVAAVVGALLACPVPVLDEESYLSIAAELTWARPYDWWRPWQPWQGAREADAFVFAHPPLFLWWVKAWWMAIGQSHDYVGVVKVAAGLPWAALLGWSVGRLSERLTRRPWLAALAWICTPISLLGLQRGLMPDLMVTALTAFSVVAWLEGTSPGGRVQWLRTGGIALAAAAWTKYPALLVVPALLAHAQVGHGAFQGQVRKTLPFWAWAGGLFLLGELWLFSQYGRIHLLEVILRAEEIGRGPLEGRALGVPVRLALGASVIPLLALRWGSVWGGSALGAAALVLVGAPEGTPLGQQLLLWLFALCGMLSVGIGVVGVKRGLERWEQRDVLLGTWLLSVVVGVVLTHNYAAPRYLLPATVPLALLLARLAEGGPSGRVLLLCAAATHGALGIAVSLAERSYFLASDEAARLISRDHPEGGFFTGEWSFRWRLTRAGWTFWTGQAPAGAIVAVPRDASPAELPGGWLPLGHHETSRGSPLRVLCAPCGVGLYSETTGALPLGWESDSLEEVQAWQVR